MSPSFFPNDLDKGEAEINIFSGRSNPRWQLSQDQRADIRNEVEMLEPTTMPELPSQLGYRGIRANLTTEDSEDTSAIWVYDGSLILWEGDDVFYFEDAGRVIEQDLLELGEPHIESEVYARVLAEFPSTP